MITLALVLCITIVAILVIAFMFGLVPLAVVGLLLAIVYFALTNMFPGWFS